MDISKKIEGLKLELKKLESITEKRFKTSKELQNHVRKYESVFQKATDSEKQIKQLEWELMTPEEKEKQEKYLRFLELKAKGEPFDPEEEGLL